MCVARIARPAFRLYLSNDVIGAEIGGAFKNVRAIAYGVAERAFTAPVLREATRAVRRRMPVVGAVGALLHLCNNAI